MLQQLAGHDGVEARIVEGERLFHVRPDRLDPKLGGFGERATIDVDADDLIAGEVRAGQRPGAAAEVEDVLPGPTDDSPERLTARGASPDEVRPAATASMAGIKGVQSFQPVDGAV
jgi:hypothetical protein